jgi:hypothetical protein
MTDDEAFARDLRRWVQRFYVERQMLAAERSRSAVERLFDRERHVLTWLSAQLMVTIALLPWWGAWGVLGGLVVLYLGTLVSGAWTLEKERRIMKRTPRGAIEAEVERALAACPRLDADARAVLIRLMNLAELRPTPRSLALLREEVRETLALPGLRQWTFLHELVAVLDGPDGPRLGTVTPQPSG